MHRLVIEAHPREGGAPPWSCLGRRVRVRVERRPPVLRRRPDRRALGRGRAYARGDFADPLPIPALHPRAEAHGQPTGAQCTTPSSASRLKASSPPLFSLARSLPFAPFLLPLLAPPPSRDKTSSILATAGDFTSLSLHEAAKRTVPSRAEGHLRGLVRGSRRGRPSYTTTIGHSSAAAAVAVAFYHNDSHN